MYGFHRRPGRRRLLWLCSGLVLAVLGTALTALPVLAHARLVSTDPPAGAVLTAAPPGVQLQFDEAISPQFSVVAVLDRAKKQVNLTPLTQPDRDETLLRTELPQSLHNGTYTVVWRILSAVDGHV